MKCSIAHVLHLYLALTSQCVLSTDTHTVHEELFGNLITADLPVTFP